MKMDPQPGMFPGPEPDHSGLSRRVIVVEANIRSGALIKAGIAASRVGSLTGAWPRRLAWQARGAWSCSEPVPAWCVLPMT